MKDTLALIGKTVMKDLIIEEYIGSGGFGDVYKAYSLLGETKLYSAVKHLVIPKEKDYHDQLNSMKNDRYATDEYFRLLYNDVLNEINLMHQWSGKSRNIIAYQHYDIDGPKGDPKQYEILIKMEYLTSLDKYSAKKDITVEEVLKMGVDIASALTVCHDEDIMHRDIKTANIFVNDKGVFKLGDFGLAKKLNESARAKSKVGTDAYKAPEVFNPYGKYDKTVDIYSFGIVLYEMFNHGRLPFMPEYPQTYGPRAVEEAIGRRVRGEILPKPMEASAEVTEVLAKACAPSPQERYQTAEELRLALQLALKGMDSTELSRVVSKAVSQADNEQKTSKEGGNSNYSYKFNDSFGKPVNQDERYVHADMFASHDGKKQRENTGAEDKDKQLWEIAKKDGTEQAIREYLKESQLKTYQLEAWALLDQIYWDNANQQGTKEGYEAYLAKNLIGKKHIVEAKDRIRQITSEADGQRNEQLDDKAWAEASRATNIEGYEKYIKSDLPLKKHLDEANDKLDDKLWTKAYRLGTKEAYEEYQMSGTKVKKNLNWAKVEIERLEEKAKEPVQKETISKNPIKVQKKQTNKKKKVIAAAILLVLLVPSTVYGIISFNVNKVQLQTTTDVQAKAKAAAEAEESAKADALAKEKAAGEAKIQAQGEVKAATEAQANAKEQAKEAADAQANAQAQAAAEDQARVDEHERTARAAAQQAAAASQAQAEAQAQADAAKITVIPVPSLGPVAYNASTYTATIPLTCPPDSDKYSVVLYINRPGQTKPDAYTFKDITVKSTIISILLQSKGLQPPPGNYLFWSVLQDPSSSTQGSPSNSVRLTLTD